MKKYQKLVLLLLFASSIQNLWAQDSLQQEIRPILRKNVLKIELLGGFSYERLLWQSGKHKLSASVVFAIPRKAEKQDSLPNLSYSHQLHSFGTGVHYFYGKRNHHLELTLQYSLASGIIWAGDWIRGRLNPYTDEYTAFGTYSSHDHVRQTTSLFNDPTVQALIDQKANFYIDNRSYQFYRSHSAAFRIGYRYQRTNGGFFFRGGLSLVNMTWFSNASMRLTLLGTTRYTSQNLPLPYLGLGWSF